MDAQVLGDRIRLVWTPPPPDGCGPLTFVVVRKRNGVLAHPGDGTRIAEVAAPEFDDLHVTPGDTVGYAVLSKRGPAESIAAISLGPFVFLADVKDVQVSAGEHEVALSWRPPAGRDRGPRHPQTRRPRRRVRATATGSRRRPTRAVDRGLDADQVFHYAIYAIYKMPDGRLFPSPGVVVRGADRRTDRQACPTRRPRHRKAPELPADPTELRATRAGGGLGSGSGAASGGVRVTLRWRWPPGTLDRDDRRPPGFASPGTERPARRPPRSSRRDDYDRQQCWTLTLPAPRPGRLRTRRPAGPVDRWTGTAAEPASPEGGPWHIRVYSVAEWDGVRSLSPGLEPSAATILPGPHPEVTVSYALKRPWLPGAPWSLTFRTEPAGATTPPLVVVAHPRAVPLSVDDGQIVARVPAACDGIRVSDRQPASASTATASGSSPIPASLPIRSCPSASAIPRPARRGSEATTRALPGVMHARGDRLAWRLQAGCPVQLSANKRVVFDRRFR